MADKLWKQTERRICRYFGCERTPLSGSNSRHTTADCLSDTYYIEIKERKNLKRLAVGSLFEKVEQEARKEKKIPILVVHQKNSKNDLVILHLKDLKL